MMARKRSPIPRLADDCSREAAAKRIDFAGAATGAGLAYIGSYTLDPAVVAGNVENFIGAAQVPIGIAGPLLVNGEYASGEFYVPLATTEGTLVASYNRSMKLLHAAGGELSLGSAIVAGEWVGAYERLGRNRLALRGFNSEKEAPWTG